MVPYSCYRHLWSQTGQTRLPAIRKPGACFSEHSRSVDGWIAGGYCLLDLFLEKREYQLERVL